MRRVIVSVVWQCVNVAVCECGSANVHHDSLTFRSSLKVVEEGTTGMTGRERRLLLMKESKRQKVEEQGEEALFWMQFADVHGTDYWYNFQTDRMTYFKPDVLRPAAPPPREGLQGITRLSFLILQGIALQLQGITPPPF